MQNFMIYKEIDDILNFSYNNVIQINNMDAEKYESNDSSITLINGTSRVLVCNALELLTEITNLGKLYVQKYKLQLDFKCQCGNIFWGENIEEPCIKNYEENREMILNSIIDWSNKYGTPFQHFCVEDQNDKPADILTYDKIKTFVIKSIIIYYISETFRIIDKLDNLLIIDEYAGASKTLRELKKLTNDTSIFSLEDKMINNFQELQKPINYNTVQKELDIIQNIKEELSFYINKWNYIFKENLSTYFYYNKIQREYYNIKTSYEVCNLAWDTLINKLVSENGNVARRKCSSCGNYFTLSAIELRKPGKKSEHCQKCKNNNSSKYRDDEKRQLRAILENMLKNGQVPKNRKKECNKILKKGIRQISKKHITKLIEELHSL